MNDRSPLIQWTPVGRTQAVVAMALTLLFSPATLQAAKIIGLESPQSFIGDTQGKDYFISNVNGEPEARDNNGFITKLDAEGKITSLKFIQGDSAGILLHAPKGLALIGQTLYVADLDQLKGFDKTTGKLLVTVSFPAPSPQPSVSLTDVAAGLGGLLYASAQAA